MVESSVEAIALSYDLADAYGVTDDDMHGILTSSFERAVRDIRIELDDLRNRRRR